MLPNGVKVKCVSDAGYFVNVYDTLIFLHISKIKIY